MPKALSKARKSCRRRVERPVADPQKCMSKARRMLSKAAASNPHTPRAFDGSAFARRLPRSKRVYICDRSPTLVAAFQGQRMFQDHSQRDTKKMPRAGSPNQTTTAIPAKDNFSKEDDMGLYCVSPVISHIISRYKSSGVFLSKSCF